MQNDNSKHNCWCCRVKPEHVSHVTNIAYGGLLKTVTPEDVTEDLIKSGYVRKAVGGLVATDTAHQYLIENGIKPQAWK